VIHTPSNSAFFFVGVLGCPSALEGGENDHFGGIDKCRLGMSGLGTSTGSFDVLSSIPARARYTHGRCL
jgi:hypothetical protein